VQLVVIIAINLALGFLVPGVSWQAHIGGMVVGGVCAALMLRTRRADQQRQQAWLVAMVAGVLVVATIARYTLV
jgi:membrane associated rhomboid family serine protease